MLFGTAATRPYRNYHIFALDEHVDRFFFNNGTFEDTDALYQGGAEGPTMTCQEDGHRDLFAYYQVTRGTAARSHEFPADCPANLWVMCSSPRKYWSDSEIKLIMAEDTLLFHCNIKTLNLIPSVMAAQKASEAGARKLFLPRRPRDGVCSSTAI